MCAYLDLFGVTTDSERLLGSVRVNAVLDDHHFGAALVLQLLYRFAALTCRQKGLRIAIHDTAIKYCVSKLRVV